MRNRPAKRITPFVWVAQSVPAVGSAAVPAASSGGVPPPDRVHLEVLSPKSAESKTQHPPRSRPRPPPRFIGHFDEQGWPNRGSVSAAIFSPGTRAAFFCVNRRHLRITTPIQKFFCVPPGSPAS